MSDFGSYKPKTAFDDTPADKLKQGIIGMFKSSPKADAAPEAPKKRLGEEIGENLVKAQENRRRLAEQMSR